MEMNIEKAAIRVAEKALDEILYKGKTLREWINLIIEFEKEHKPKEDIRFLCNSCKHKYRCERYAEAKEFIEQSPVNYMSCNLYIKE